MDAFTIVYKLTCSLLKFIIGSLAVHYKGWDPFSKYYGVRVTLKSVINLINVLCPSERKQKFQVMVLAKYCSIFFL